MNKAPTLPPKKVFSRVKKGQHLWLFLDYDGTLADFAPTPDVIIPEEGLIHLLTKLTRHPRLHTAIISGRRLQHIEQLAPVEGLWLAGTYGIEIRKPDGERVYQLDYERVRPVLEEVKPVWQRILPESGNFYLEDKGWSLAIHARFAPQDEADRVIGAATKAAREMIDLEFLHLLGGHKFLEVCPRIARKPEGIAYIMENEAVADAVPVYIGDDDKDEVAFRAVEKLGGITLVVSKNQRPTNAMYRLESPKAVRAWLSELYDYLSTQE